MLTFILIIVFALTLGLLLLKGNLKFAETIEAPGSYGREKIKFHWKKVFAVIVIFVAILVQPYNIERIDSGWVGLQENFTGETRGIQGVQLVSGFQPYNTYTSAIHEIPLDQKTVHYPKFEIILKGGLTTIISPSFNYKVKPASANLLFVELREAFKNGGLQNVQDNWMTVIVQSAINNVGNRFEVDSVFNNKEGFDNQISLELNKKLSKWFEIDEFKSNIVPPGSLKKIIDKKIASIQEAQTFELDALKAVSEAKKKVAIAQGEYDSEVINFKTKQLKAQPAVLAVYNAETKRQWAEKGVSEYGTGNVFGTGAGILIQK